MNGISQIMAGDMPKIISVEPAEELNVQVVWSRGPRAGRTEKVDLAPLINSLKFFKPLRDNRVLFETVHLAANGEVLSWGDNDEIDMAATSVERLAREMMTAEDFKSFIAEMGYTHSSAAAMLGYSRRQIENFLSGTQPVPRVCVLACMALKQHHISKQKVARTSVSTDRSGLYYLFFDFPNEHSHKIGRGTLDNLTLTTNPMPVGHNLLKLPNFSCADLQPLMTSYDDE